MSESTVQNFNRETGVNEDPTIFILRWMRAKGMSSSYRYSDIPLPSGFNQEDTDALIRKMIKEKLLETVSIPAGYFSIGGIKVAAKGDKTLDIADNVDYKTKNASIALQILGQAISDDGPFLPEISEVSSGRISEITKALLDSGNLATASKQQGFFTISAFQITEQGKTTYEKLKRQVASNDVVTSALGRTFDAT